MTYRVTARDIVKGKPGDSFLCPVARSLRRRHTVAGVQVCSHKAWIGDQTVNLPMRVWRWIDRFDSGQAVRPMRFELL